MQSIRPSARVLTRTPIQRKVPLKEGKTTRDGVVGRIRMLSCMHTCTHSYKESQTGIVQNGYCLQWKICEALDYWHMRTCAHARAHRANTRFIKRQEASSTCTRACEDTYTRIDTHFKTHTSEHMWPSIQRNFLQKGSDKVNCIIESDLYTLVAHLCGVRSHAAGGSISAA